MHNPTVLKSICLSFYLMFIATTVSAQSTRLHIDFDVNGFLKDVSKFNNGYLLESESIETHVYVSGRMDKYNGSPILTCITSSGEEKWSKEVKTYNSSNVVLNDDNMAYVVNLSYHDSRRRDETDEVSPIRISILGEDGTYKVENAKVDGIFNQFSDFRKVKDVNAEYVAAKDGNVYILFSHQVKRNFEYYLCRIDMESNTQIVKIDYSNSKGFSREDSGYRLVHMDENNLYFSKANVDRGEAIIVSIDSYSLTDLSYQPVLNSVKIQGVPHFHSFRKDRRTSLETRFSIDDRSDIIRHQEFDNGFTGEDAIAYPNSYFSCNKVGDDWLIYGLYTDTKEKRNIGNFHGLWVVKIMSESEQKLYMHSCLDFINESFLLYVPTYMSFGIFNEKLVCYTTIHKMDGLIVYYPEEDDLHLASSEEMEEVYISKTYLFRNNKTIGLDNIIKTTN